VGYVCPVREKLGNRRVTGTEQYYTPKQLALQLVERTLSQIPNYSSRVFIEPAGGTGSFIDALTAHGIEEVISVDTEPLHHKVLKHDFLQFDPGVGGAVTISNPPFGRNNALSVPFFNHAAQFSDYIAFLVPRSWRKWSVINRLDPNFHLLSDLDVKVIYQSPDGQDIAQRNDLRTCFQIWERRETQRQRVVVPDHGFVSRSNPQQADIAMRVFGFGCGTVYRDFPRVPNTTMMYLSVKQQELIDVLEGLDYGEFSHRTAYTKALALPEINYLLNQKLLGDGFHPKGHN
jgi:predicted RNA methylase